MSFKVTYDQLNHEEVGNALGFLYYSKLSPKTAVKIAKIKKTIDEEVKTAREQYQNILKKYCKLTEDGKVMFTEQGTPVFNEGAKEAYDKDFAEFKAIEFEVNQQKIYLPELDKIHIAPSEIEALSFCIES